MSKLFNCENALVEDKKLIEYLLNINHDEGKSKANFFEKFGFYQSQYQVLKKSLEILACKGEVINQIEKPPFGTRITIIGEIISPDGRNPKIKTGWFVDSDEINKIPRFITAVPFN